MAGTNGIENWHDRSMPKYFFNMVLIHKLSKRDVLILRFKELIHGCFEL